MSYGFQILNSNGIVQVDQNYSNYHLIASGSTTVFNRSSTTAITRATISWPAQPSPCMVFIRPDIGQKVGGSPFANQRPDFRSEAYLYGNGPVGADPFSAQYAVFALRSEFSIAQGFGIQVRNPEGQVVFCSDTKTLRLVLTGYNSIVDSGGYPVISAGWDNPIAIPAGRGQPYFLLNTTGWYEGYIEGATRESWGFTAGFLSDTSFQMDNLLMRATAINRFKQGLVPYVIARI